jgi:serine/threonine protein kinase
VWACSECKAIFPTEQAICPNEGAPVRKAASDPLIGEAVDRYRIQECIGRGATGRVYLATHAVIARKYAVKILYGNFSGNPSFMERFRREAYTASQIRHPNVVSVEDFGTTSSGLAFLVMEFVSGVTLESLIKRNAPLTPKRAAGILKQVASGLAEAHSHGFVHRDMKPSNIMLTEAHGLEFIKILDFGAVKMPTLPESVHLTAAGFIIGTPAYMAPEQTRSGTLGPEADLYALGVILYEMLTGRLPFDGNSYTEIMMQHLEAPPPPLPPSAGLELLVSWLLEKSPNDRPSNASMLIKELERLETGFRSSAFNASSTLVLTRAPELTATRSSDSMAAGTGSSTRNADATPTADFSRMYDTLIENPYEPLATVAEEPDIGIHTVAESMDLQGLDTLSIRHERSTLELRAVEGDSHAGSTIPSPYPEVYDTDGDHAIEHQVRANPDHFDTLDEPVEALLPRIHRRRQSGVKSAPAEAFERAVPPSASSKPIFSSHWTVTALIIVGVSLSAVLLFHALVLRFGE